ncbi:MAG: hypothetical protein BGO09_10550 [Bacteroidetes bacterium 47-18]|nr:MAG: hypothetical protein BGO09_10550 [Bacteroidetes bacterium 47-18]
MDILKLIEEQIKHIKKDSASSYLDLIYNHLNRAEIYFNNGKQDDHFYNDVVYRTNQAYEGALKEAYKILVNKTDEEVSRKTPNEIEKYLKENDIFKERVLKLFENYRQEWRNKSTHDYKLVLDESEAFLALMNVTSFVHLLLRQIQEKIAYDTEFKRETPESIKTETKKILKEQESLVDRVLKLLALFVQEQGNIEKLNEIDVVGRLHAFIEKVDDKFTVYREFPYKIGSSIVRIDLVVEYDNEKIILEIKRNPVSGKLTSDIDQVTSYLALTGLKNGILFFCNTKAENGRLTVHHNNVIVNEMDYNVYVVL